jgi:glycosyltransferase involved in cell wall biosynthesis
MKLLIVCQAVDAEHQNLGFFVRWIAEFAKHAELVTVIANHVGVHSLPDNVRVYSLGKERGAGRLSRYWTFAKTLHTVRNSYTHVFCHMNPEFVIAGAWLWRLAARPVVLWYVHGTVSVRLRLAVALANAVCTTDESSLRIQNPKIHRVGHGIDTDFFKPGYRLQHDEALIVSASRIAPSKHIDTIIDAIVAVKESGTAVPKAYQYIKMLGPQTQTFVRDALASADIFVNASTTGSIDKAVLEAAASGSIPVSSNSAFKPMLEAYGLFVPAVTAEAFAEVIATVLRRTDRHEVSEQLRAEVVAHHNLSSCISHILACYKDAKLY